MHDCVYPLSPGTLDFDELRYSLRSVETNTGAERVWFIGGKPKWLKTANHIPTKQPHSKWRNARINMRAAVDCDEISDPYWHFNDDFYVLKDVGTELPLWHGGSYLKWLADLGSRYARSTYVREGQETVRVLQRREIADPLCWSLHVPLLIYKEPMRRALDLDAKFGFRLHPRTLYANLAGLEGERAPCKDVKGTGVPRYLYASSSNASWPRSPLGRHVRSMFTEPSRGEFGVVCGSVVSMKFCTVIADPPWAYAKTSRHESLSGYSDAEYRPLSTDDLCSLPVADLVTDDAVLLLWATWPFLPDALQVIDAWGFTFVTGLPWVKVTTQGSPTYGVGFWFRGCTEPILVAKRKKAGAPSYRSNFQGLLVEDAGGLIAQNLKHSRKPESLHQVAEAHYPGPRLELFARQQREGWFCRGNECPGDERDIRESLEILRTI